MFMNLKVQHCSSYQNEEYSSCRTAAQWEARSSRSFESRGSWWWPTPVMWRWQYFQSQWYAVFKLSDRSIRIKRWRYWLGNFSMLASLVRKRNKCYSWDLQQGWSQWQPRESCWDVPFRTQSTRIGWTPGTRAVSNNYIFVKIVSNKINLDWCLFLIAPPFPELQSTDGHLARRRQWCTKIQTCGISHLDSIQYLWIMAVNHIYVV